MPIARRVRELSKIDPVFGERQFPISPFRKQNSRTFRDIAMPFQPKLGDVAGYKTYKLHVDGSTGARMVAERSSFQ
jgi:hypothetical protein